MRRLHVSAKYFENVTNGGYRLDANLWFVLTVAVIQRTRQNLHIINTIFNSVVVRTQAMGLT